MSTAGRPPAPLGEADFAAVVDRLPVAVYRSLPDGTLVHLNPAGLELLGYAPDRSPGPVNAIQHYVDPADRERWIAALKTEGVARGFEIRCRRGDGRGVWGRHKPPGIRDQPGA